MNDHPKVLVAYFSCSGVTKKVAETLARAAGADLFEIKPKVPYTKADLNWMDKKSRSTAEMENKASRPLIAEMVPNMSAYSTVFVGFPIWWYIAPTIINTFLEGHDMTGKTIVPFATSGGSGFGETVKYLKPSCSSTVKWHEGKLLNGHLSETDLKKWVSSIMQEQ